MRNKKSFLPGTIVAITSLVISILLISGGSIYGKEIPEPKKVSFYKDIKPLLQRDCFGCHQPAKNKGNYVMTEFSALLKGGESEEPAVIPGKPQSSLLLAQITPIDGEAEMPPNKDPLAKVEIDLIARWIAEGAHDDTPANAKIQYSVENPPVYFGAPTITSLKYSPDGKNLAVAGYHEVLLLHAESGAIEKRLVGASERIQSIAWSPDGKMLAVAGGNPGRAGEIQIWNAEKGSLELSYFSTYDTLLGVSWSPDGTKVAYGATDNAVRAITVPKGEQVLFQGSHDDWPLDTTFSTDGNYVISVGRDMTAKLTELSTQRFIDNITSITPGALKGGINAVRAHPGGKFILFGGADGSPKIYQYIRTTNRQIGDDANQIMVLPSQPGRIFDVAWNSNGTRVASVSSLHGNGYLTVSEVPEDLTPPKEIRDILVKPTHQRNGDMIKKLNAYFAEKAKVVMKHEFPGAPQYAVSIGNNDQSVAATGKGGTITIFSLADRKKSVEFQAMPEITSVADGGSDREAGNINDPILPNERPAELPFQTLPKGIDITGISVQPSQLVISEPNSYAQMVVSAAGSDGSIWDVSRLVRYDHNETNISITRTGFVKPNANGQSTIEISMGDLKTSVPVTVSGLESEFRPDWSLHVNPVLSRLGCNAGTCHGSKDGKNGFKLSLRGYDPVMDITSLTDDIGSRRVNFAAPTKSLMLLKSSAEIPHEGGQLVTPKHDYYQTLEKWILDGGDVSPSADKKVAELRIFPKNPVVEREGYYQQMKVIAVYPDGRERDVTREAFLESGGTEIAEKVTGWPGLVKALRRGEAPVLVRYEGAYASTIMTVMGDRSEFVWKEPEYNNRIDQLVAEKWKRMKIRPSGLADDHTFVRRLYLDLTGMPPTPEQVESFVNSTLPTNEKRDILIDELLHGDAYVDHWANKWADLLQVNSKFLGGEGTKLFRKWIHNEVAQNTPYDSFVRKIITANGSNRVNPPASYYKILRDPELTMENTTHLFLATRFNCNKCHDHPFEKWTQDQYYEMAAFFARTSLKKDPESKDKNIGGTAVESAKPLFEEVYENDKGEMTHQRTGLETPPQFPFNSDAVSWEKKNRREVLADWMTSTDNPYFASSYVNRLWGYMLGTGIIEPLDDIRAGNPPSNPQLLEYLTSEFISSNFDTRHIIRLIGQSRTYQLSVESNRWNEDDQINFSHAKARRLPAEVLYDAIHTVLGSTPRIPGVTPGTRAAALPDSAIKLKDGFLGNFGRPARESSCECERSSDLQLGPVMALISGPTLGNAISDKENILSQLIKSSDSEDQWINALFMRILNRPASENEIQATIDTLKIQPAEHTRLVGQLEAYLEQTREVREAQTNKRNGNIAKAEKSLAEFKTYWEAEKAKRTAARKAEADALEAQSQAKAQALKSNLNNLTSSYDDQTQWLVPETAYQSASNGTELRNLGEGKFMAGGKLDKSTYEFYVKPMGHQLTGVRLDALPHDSLPKKGPGRAKGDGNFVLTEIVAEYFEPESTASGPLDIKVWDTTSGENSGWKPGKDTSWVASTPGSYVISSESNDPSITTEIDAPAGWYKFEALVEVKGDKGFTSQLFFSEEKAHNYSEGMSRQIFIDPAAGAMQNVSFLIEAKKAIKSLRFDPSTDKGDSTVYQISLTSLGKLKSTQLKFSNAVSDFNQGNFEVKKAINNNQGDNDGWAIAPQMGKPHTALFVLDKPLNLVGNNRGFVKISLVQNYNSKSHSLGFFQLQTTSSEKAAEFGISADIASILSTPAARRSESQNDRLAQFVITHDKEYQELQKKLAEARKPVADDPKLAQLESALKTAQMPLPVDPVLEQLKRDVELSKQQLTNPELTVAQDLAWALINSPAFLFNH